MAPGTAACEIEKVSSHFDVEEELPSKRFLNQTFVFVGRESAENYAVCEEEFDDYFNLTWTYKLDSDVVWPYFTVFNKKGEEIAPSLDVNWTAKVKPISAKIGKAIVNVKKYPAVWMVSNCYTQSRRETYFNELKVALQWYGFEIHVIGSCGTRQCPFERDKECIKKLKQYYFYLALENSISEDYVTEKVMKALLHYTVPVVFGGANYSRFLPPDSYINGRDLGPKKTAEKMAKLIINQTEYLHYFSWQNHYIIRNKTDTVCKLCEALYKGVGKVHNNFRKWWNPHYKKKCEAQEAASRKNGEIPRVPWNKIEKFSNYVNSDIQVKKLASP
ncbi:alpha-(1,3)-fucosyltransferase C-like [Ostrinia furnacalis]|uniref:alpha-(1,3)-fucosyltransferase C-like n=1 Tax=Ostrinia furnacalis TaxID=93504 RepID=UPI00103A7593|nr:alpha-(1,3)-fucosyltransferase C-like [Ostrinia furnacalis]